MLLFKNKFYAIAWLGILNLPLALYFGQSYAPTYDSAPWFMLATMICAAIGHFFLYFLLGSLILIFPVFAFKKGLGKWRYIYATVILSLLHITLATDAQVYELYRFHLSFVMLDLFFNAGGEVISLSSDTWISIAIQVAAIVIYSAVILAIALGLSLKKVKSRIFVILALLMYALANLINAYGVVKPIQPIIEIRDRLPFYYPLTMTSYLRRNGWISENSGQLDSIFAVDANRNSTFFYPKQPLRYFDNPIDPYNVVLITIDSLRHDMVTDEIMPYTANFARKSMVFNNHYSGSNATRGGIFSLFYGLPPSYWRYAHNSLKGAALIQAFQERNYSLGIFSSANLYMPEFNNTVFASVPNLRIQSQGISPIDRDESAISDFIEFIKQQSQQGASVGKQRFFSFVFLDAVHSYASPEDSDKPFQPAATTVNHLELKPNTDPTPIFNLYKNAAHAMDVNVQRILRILSDYGFAENTVVIITSDHGEEFNDNRDNYWGHNSNFTDVQLKVPFIMYWPNKEPEQINEISSHYDLSATLMSQVLGVKNPLQDYTIGQNLFKLRPSKYVLVGSYFDNAIVESDRIVVIDKFGLLSFKDKQYKVSSNDKRDAAIFDAIKLMSYYLTDNNGGEEDQNEQEDKKAASTERAENAERTGSTDRSDSAEVEEAEPDSNDSSESDASDESLDGLAQGQ